MAAPDSVRFACDAMLGGLARWLRAAGYAASWHPGIDDRLLIGLARDEGRVLLSSDSRIFLVGLVRDGVVASLFIPRDLDPPGQVRFVLDRLQLPVREPRCMACGGELVKVTKEEVRDRVPPRTFAWLDEYWRCSGCHRTFWKGTHWQRIEACLAEAGGKAERR